MTNDFPSFTDQVKAARSKYADAQKELMRLRAENASLRENLQSAEADLAAQEKAFAAEKVRLHFFDKRINFCFHVCH